MGVCADCKFFEPLTIDEHSGSTGVQASTGYGSCTRWDYGYGTRDALPPNGVMIENDEGWGAYMGPQFGCVLFESK